ncbi:MAG: glutamate-1-semialdehyde 2,1-aminomutase [Deltaproteobacteria bacterium]|jgi:glutamate-1-semialdehyde 2,1-aminomutase|nr:glutamate-1-semialdehyde 2,1-aminomutase [Deltaproteobacteria bacterium]MBT6432324.1 glutamate-1-semialdehyde 2,1-aminomutase [Deltaproteobacteria bacterium]MBT6489867.1 glutamate-1-semialdehyde 2,1-aminomutase [Deltaproteobacteria bacterium]
MNTKRSESLNQRATKLMPGGVNSPVRAFGSVGGSPVFIDHAQGSTVTDVDGNDYLDYVCSWGPLILGHAHPAVVATIQEAAVKGTSFGAATEKEVELAERVTRLVPSVEVVRFVSSGTEATMSALRLARGFTGRDRCIKFSGCYHGHTDAFLTDAGSGVATLGIPGSAGVPEGTARDTITLPYNDLEALDGYMAEHGDEVAAIILEPIACNMGMVKPNPGFLDGLRRACDQAGALLIFDEVITGFRVALGGAQELYGVKPDLTTFGKIIGAGLPVGAYGGRADIMSKVAPLGPVYQAGTLSGNPLAMAAGIAALDELAKPGVYESLEEKGAYLEKGISTLLKKYGRPGFLNRCGSIFYLWLSEGAEACPKDYADVKRGNTELYGSLFRELLNRGVYLAPSGFEVGFISTAHTFDDLDKTLEKMDEAFTAALSGQDYTKASESPKPITCSSITGCVDCR